MTLSKKYSYPRHLPFIPHDSPVRNRDDAVRLQRDILIVGDEQKRLPVQSVALFEQIDDLLSVFAVKAPGRWV